MSDDLLIPVFIPALRELLLNAERGKGAPLTSDEVMAIRDGGACILLPIAEARQIRDQRGYDDLHPEQVWDQWQANRHRFLVPSRVEIETCLTYFRQAVNDPAGAQPWDQWWTENAELVARIFPLVDYVRLKHRRLRGAREILQRAGELPSDF